MTCKKSKLISAINSFADEDPKVIEDADAGTVK